MNALIISIPAFKDNYIWMLQQDKNVWIFDPGDAFPVIQILKQQQLNLKGILITHHHYDHTAGIENLLAYQAAPVIGFTQPITEADEVICGNITFKILEIPGHTLDHVAYYTHDWVFCGDTLFSAGCGKIFEGTPLQMYQSLQKLARLSDTTQVYCGHEYTLANLLFAQTVEPDNVDIQNKILKVKTLRANNQVTLPSTLGEEKKINPFLRCTTPSVIQAVEKHTGRAIMTPVEVFTHLREWKNNFKP
jgi:hydroxyacylglutathione hydrolase